TLNCKDEPQPKSGRSRRGAALLGALLLTGVWGAKSFGAAPQEPVAELSPPPPSPRSPAAEPPLLLSETGLYEPGSTTRIAPDNIFYIPQYPLWSDGAKKRRWISIPRGTRIDASNPDAWEFPIGTRLWKEFSFGERTETRYIERISDGSY